MENRLYQIPMSDAAFYDQVAEVVESEDIHDLYSFWERYIDHVKAQSRRRG